MPSNSDAGGETIQLRDEIDPGIRQFLDEITQDSIRLGGRPGLAPEERRRIAEKARARWTEGGPVMHSTRETHVGPQGTKIRIYSPTGGNETLPALVYMHGGGWTIFSLDTHDRLMREYAARASVAVVGVDYSLAPESKFPTAVEEVVHVVDWIRAEGERFGLDSTRIATGGDSAGANLALATNLALRDQGADVVNAMLLNYGAYDMSERPSHRRYDGDDYMLTVAEMAAFWSDYLRGAEDEANPLARPFNAEFTGMPPAFLCIPQCDILADENREMARRLEEAGAAVTAKVYERATHSFLEAMSVSPVADHAIEEAAKWLNITLCERSG